MQRINASQYNKRPKAHPKAKASPTNRKTTSHKLHPAAKPKNPSKKQKKTRRIEEQATYERQKILAFADKSRHEQVTML